METLRLVVGYFLVAFPPLFGIGMLLEPNLFFYKFSPNAPYVIAAALVVVMVLSMAFSFGLYLLKKKSMSLPIKR